MNNDSSRSNTTNSQPQNVTNGDFLFNDWQEGHLIDRCCLKKIVRGAGLTSYSGDGEREFELVCRYLERTAGFDKLDFLEATYSGFTEEGAWRPSHYDITHVQESIPASIKAYARELEWYRERMPAARFYLLGYSLGGLIAFETAGELLSRNYSAWRGRIAGVALLSAPLLGIDFGILGRIAHELAQRPQFFGPAGVELVERGQNREALGEVEATAALLRSSGAKLLFVVDRNDAVVTESDAIIPSARKNGEVVFVDASMPPDADEGARRFGHGPVLFDSRSINAITRLIGNQECFLGGHGPLGSGEAFARSRQAAGNGAREVDPIEAELEKLRAELRANRGKSPA